MNTQEALDLFYQSACSGFRPDSSLVEDARAVLVAALRGQGHHPPPPDLSATIAMMRSKYVLKLSLPDGTSLELDPRTFDRPLPRADADEKPPTPRFGVENDGEPTDDQMLGWSAPGELPAADGKTL